MANSIKVRILLWTFSLGELRPYIISLTLRIYKLKHPGAFEKELVMTSDQASMKNQLLPKGYIYVPLKSLPKEKQTKPEGNSDG